MLENLEIDIGLVYILSRAKEYAIFYREEVWKKFDNLHTLGIPEMFSLSFCCASGKVTFFLIINNFLKDTEIL